MIIIKKENIHFGPCMGINNDGDQLEQYSHDGTVLVVVAVPVIDSGASLVLITIYIVPKNWVAS